MVEPATKSIGIHARAEEFDAAREFLIQVLDSNRVSKETARDVGLIFEALFSSILAQGFGSDTVMKVSEQKRFGAVDIKIEFEGERFRPQTSVDDLESPEAELLWSYGDKIDYGYQLGCNTITITVRRKGGIWILTNIGAMLLAFVAYAVLVNVLDQQTSKASQRTTSTISARCSPTPRS